MAINVDHSIRKTSYKDSLFVEDYCKNNDIPFFFKKINCIELKQNSKCSSMEEIARNARYDYFNQLFA